MVEPPQPKRGLGGVIALGPVLVVRHLMVHGREGATPAPLRAATPYATLVLVLALARRVPPLRDALELVTLPLPAS